MSVYMYMCVCGKPARRAGFWLVYTYEYIYIHAYIYIYMDISW